MVHIDRAQRRRVCQKRAFRRRYRWGGHQPGNKLGAIRAAYHVAAPPFRVRLAAAARTDPKGRRLLLLSL